MNFVLFNPEFLLHGMLVLFFDTQKKFIQLEFSQDVPIYISLISSIIKSKMKITFLLLRV